ncbi:MAG: phosphotransferase [Deltaproteobacteria bacterium]|nr:phosphotransferase [Deltaproteobacteria bacterium]
MFVLPQGYKLTTKGRAAIALHERYCDCLLGQGIEDPEKLLRSAAALPAPSGRGSVPSLPVNGFPGERMMARRYLRGGLMRFINRGLYLDGERAFRELAITVEAASCGIPTVEVLAAVSIKAAGPLYRCFLFTRELPECIDLPAYLRGRSAAGSFSEDKQAVLERAAAAARLMHDRGFFHADLNMKNILVDTAKPESLYIIDWDKSRRFDLLSHSRRTANIVRFCRSMIKLAGKGVPVYEQDADLFLRAYSDDGQFVRICRERLQRSVALRKNIWKLVDK